MNPCRLAVRFALLAALAGCAGTRPAVAPLDMVVDRAPATSGPRALLVFMPGIREVPDDLVRRGFVDAVRKRGIAADVIIPDTHIGYFRNRTFIERLREDVIAPARARGYDEIWLAGISLGGFGSLLYASRAGADEIDGIIAVAPFLGDDRLANEVADAGGLIAWRASPAPANSVERRLLQWLQGYADPANERPPLYIGFGASDAFAGLGGQVANLLPPQQSVTAAGGHEWAPWVTIWDTVLDRAPLPRVAPPAQAQARR